MNIVREWVLKICDRVSMFFFWNLCLSVKQLCIIYLCTWLCVFWFSEDLPQQFCTDQQVSLLDKVGCPRPVPPSPKYTHTQSLDL